MAKGITRRNFLKFSAGTTAGAGVLGFNLTPAYSRVGGLKIGMAKVSKTVCPYCSVSCGVLVYSQTDGSGNGKTRAVHVEGNPDDPVNRGSLCPKGATLIDFLNSPLRLDQASPPQAGGGQV